MLLSSEETQVTSAKNPKLRLNKETVRVLTVNDMAGVVGGILFFTPPTLRPQTVSLRGTLTASQPQPPSATRG
jgi:hypothetical protein